MALNFFGWITNLFNEPPAHRAAWEEVFVVEENGLNLFQNRCSKALLDAFFHIEGLRSEQQIEVGYKGERTVTGTLPKTQVKYQIFPDSVQIGPYYFLSSQDYDTPDALINDFIRFAKQTTTPARPPTNSSRRRTPLVPHAPIAPSLGSRARPCGNNVEALSSDHRATATNRRTA